MSPQAPAIESAECKPVPLSVHCLPPPTRQPHRGRVLHVDDDPMARMVFAGWFGHHHYQHRQAVDPAEADALLTTGAFDVVLSDIHMPGNNQLEWVEQLVARESAPAVILITGLPEFATACRAANLPVAGYLVKPVELRTLDELLQRVIGGQRRRDEFLSLSHDILQLLGTRSLRDTAQESQLVGKLAMLAGCFGNRRPDQAGDAPGDRLWRAAIADTIDVIEKTKHSFRSRELGQLRIRLQRLLTAA